MAKFARENGIKIDAELEKNADKILSTDDELKDLDAKIKRYVNSTSDSTSEHWLGDPEMRQIRNRHFHFSSKVGAGYNPRFGKDKVTRTRFVVDA